MAILNIEKANSSFLREKCEEIKEITPAIEKLALNMADTMKANKGIGLAACQVGILKRIIVIQPDFRSPAVLAFINPKIIGKSKDNSILEEGCLSFPSMFFNISRPKEVEVESLDLKGKKIKIKANGVLSHVFQHEIDHLDGIVFIDRLSFRKKLKLKLRNLWR
jgi:peptide deformylase